MAPCKVVPQAVNLEEAIRGNDARQTAVNAVIDVLGSESFYKPSHKKILRRFSSCLMILNLSIF